MGVIKSFLGNKVYIRPQGFLDASNAALIITPNEIKIFEKIIHKPYGMILVTGPTGSGKTTTLYAALREINTQERKIITVEDPVEYNADHVNQIQVNEKVGLTFAAGLRSILRQDPDVIMIGEIRDKKQELLLFNQH